MTNSLSDTFMIGLCWHDSYALRGIRLQVRDSELEEADDILRAGISVAPDIQSERGLYLCPSCRADELFLDYGSRKTLAVMIFFPIPLWLWRTRERCGSCGYSRRVPLLFRPALALAIILAALFPIAVIAVLMLAFAFFASLRIS